MFFAANKMSRMGSISIKYQGSDDCIAITIEMNFQKSDGFTCTITYTEVMFNCLQSWIKVIIHELIDNVCKSNFINTIKKIHKNSDANRQKLKMMISESPKWNDFFLIFEFGSLWYWTIIARFVYAPKCMSVCLPWVNRN